MGSQQMLQWAVWRVLPEVMALKDDQTQHLSEKIAEALYALGVRFPNHMHYEEQIVELRSDLFTISKEIGPVPIPDKALRGRAQIMAKQMVERGWRKTGNE